MNAYVSWILGHLADLKSLLDIEEKMRADFPSAGGFGSIYTWAFVTHHADLAQAEAIVKKIEADFPGTAPVPGNLHALCVEAASNLKGADEAIGDGHLFQWFLQNAPQIISTIEQLIAMFKKPA